MIITSEALKNAPSDPPGGVYNFQDLLAHKAAAGVTGTIVTVEQIYANYSGADQQEKIRNFIIDAYNNWETDFVLLGGDADGQDFGNDDTEAPVVPVRILDCLYVYSHGNIASDLYYQCLDGNFDYNGDGVYGRPGDGPDDQPGKPGRRMRSGLRPESGPAGQDQRRHVELLRLRRPQRQLAPRQVHGVDRQVRSQNDR